MDDYMMATAPLLGRPTVVSDRVGTTYMSLLWGMSVGDIGLQTLIALAMPCADHYNYGND